MSVSSLHCIAISPAFAGYDHISMFCRVWSGQRVPSIHEVCISHSAVHVVMYARLLAPLCLKCLCIHARMCFFWMIGTSFVHRFLRENHISLVSFSVVQTTMFLTCCRFCVVVECVSKEGPRSISTLSVCLYHVLFKPFWSPTKVVPAPSWLCYPQLLPNLFHDFMIHLVCSVPLIHKVRMSP